MYLLLFESDITIADLTLTRAYHHPVHVAPETHSTTGTVIHNLRIVDGASQFIKINPDNGFYTDHGIVRCSSLEMTDAGRAEVRNNCYTGGIDAHQARGWQVYGNVFSGFWCSTGLSEHAIHFWTGSRDTIVDRNVIINSARGVGFGLGENTAGRNYSDQPCSGKTGMGHYGGSITNTFVFANDPRLFASAYRFDVGISLEQSCNTNVLHNTVFSTTAPASSSIEWRFTKTTATVANNLVSHNLLAREGGVATLAGNVTSAPGTLFVNATTGDLHLRSTATSAISRGAQLATPVWWDIDSAARDAAPDVGADELTNGGFTLTAPLTVIVDTPILVLWVAPLGQATTADWIGLFAAGSNDSQAIDMKSTGGLLTGSVIFTAPNATGVYEARYFNGTSAVRVAVSAPISVTAATPPSPPTGDAEPPTVSITSPANGDEVPQHVDVIVNATDNVAVTKVELYVDGALREVSTTAPFTMTWNPTRPGEHTLQLKAYDGAGNVGTSSPVVVIK